jgi:hypothetical protein
MIKDDLVLTIPNPHSHEISVDLLARILKQAGIPREEWLGATERYLKKNCPKALGHEAVC